MDGVNVEQAIGRDRIRNALRRYENKPVDEHRYGIVRAVNADGSYEVLLDGDVQTSRCSQFDTAEVGDRVLAVTKKDGTNDLLGRLGGPIGGGGSSVVTYDDVSNYIAGRVFAYAGTDEPIGALLCDGRAVSRTTYWELFAAIGTTYGEGDGSSTFNLPNIESRTIIGESDSYALGAVGGEEKHKLTEAELPSHDHFHFLDVNGYITSDSGMNMISNAGYAWKASGKYTPLDTSDTGGDQPHNIMQPYIVMRYFITTGKGDPVSGINPADYVVEWGQTDGWNWRKYASGWAECWREITVSCAATNGYGGLYYESKGPYSFPFSFKSAPNVQATTFMGNGLWNVSVHTLTSSNFYFYAQSSTSMTGNPTFMFHASGWWKDSPASGGTETIAPTIAERFAELEEKLADAEARLAEAEYDTGWEHIYYVADKIIIKARRVGKMVTVSGRAYSGYFPAPAGSWAAVTTLPEKFRPSGIVYAALGSDVNNHVGMADVEPDGLIYVISAGIAINSWGFSITYPVG